MSTTYGEKEFREWLAEPVFKPAPPDIFASGKRNPYSSQIDSGQMFGDVPEIEKGTKIELDPTLLHDYPPCSRTEILGDVFWDLLKKKLPSPDCFHGTGFGVWDDPFNAGYNMEFQNDYNTTRRQWANQWTTLGVKYVQYGGMADNVDVIRMWNGIDNSLELVGNPVVTSAFPLSGALNNIMDGVSNANDLYDPTSQFNQSLNSVLSARTSAMNHIYFDEPEGHNFLANPDLFFDCLGKVLYDNPSQRSGPCRIKISIASYRTDVISAIINAFPDAVGRGCLTLMPEQYYNVEFAPFTRRWQFWEDVADEAMSTTGGMRLNRTIRESIRPMISPVCAMCGANDELNGVRYTDKCCNPEYLIYDVIHAMELGFSGPVLYMGNGMSQEFYDYFILASWLAGCIDVPGAPAPFDKRPVQYTELFSLLDQIKLNPALLTTFKNAVVRDNTGFTGVIYDNPGTCTRYCSNGSESVAMGPCCGLKPCRNTGRQTCPNVIPRCFEPGGAGTVEMI